MSGLSRGECLEVRPDLGPPERALPPGQRRQDAVVAELPITLELRPRSSGPREASLPRPPRFRPRLSGGPCPGRGCGLAGERCPASPGVPQDKRMLRYAPHTLASVEESLHMEVRLHDHGGSDVMRLEVRPAPAPSADDILVKFRSRRGQPSNQSVHGWAARHGRHAVNGVPR